MKGFDDHLDNYGDPGGYCGSAGTRNPEEPADAAYLALDPGGSYGSAYSAYYIPSEAELDDDDELEGMAEESVITGEYPDIEAFMASRRNHPSQWKIHDEPPLGWNAEVSSRTQSLIRGSTHLDRGVPREDLIALLAYNWRDEECDYYNTLRSQDITAAELNKTHVFAAMQRINDWLNS